MAYDFRAGEAKKFLAIVPASFSLQHHNPRPRVVWTFSTEDAKNKPIRVVLVTLSLLILQSNPYEAIFLMLYSVWRALRQQSYHLHPRQAPPDSD